MSAIDLYRQYLESGEETVSLSLARQIATDCVNEIKNGNAEFACEIVACAELKYGVKKSENEQDNKPVIKAEDIDLLAFCLEKEISFEAELADFQDMPYTKYFKKPKAKKLIKKCNLGIGALFKSGIGTAEDKPLQEESAPEKAEQGQDEKPAVISVKIAIDEAVMERDNEFKENFEIIRNSSQSAYDNIESYTKRLGSVIEGIAKAESLQSKIDMLQKELKVLSDSTVKIGESLEAIIDASGEEQFTDIKQQIKNSYDLASAVVNNKHSKDIEAAVNSFYDVYVLMNSIYKQLPENADNERRNTKQYLEKIRDCVSRCFSAEFFESEAGTGFDARLHRCFNTDFDPDTAAVKTSEICGIKINGEVVKKEIVSI